ncbi:MAG: type 1 glutamine amidotransferase [Planctomycetota bacterium]
MSILVLRHDRHTTPGRLGSTLRDLGFKLDIRSLPDGDAVPASMRDHDGIVCLGAEHQIDQGHHWLDTEIALLRESHERSLPTLGICFGAQLIAKALGGEVGPMEQPDAGFPMVNLNGPPAHSETLLVGIPWSCPQFCRHSYEIKDPPPGAQVLASSQRTKVQVFKLGMRTIAFQYHFETEPETIESFISKGENFLHRAGVTTAEFREQIRTHHDIYARAGERQCENIATYLIPKVGIEVRV